MSLTEIAKKISAHLKRFEADKMINARRPDFRNTTPYYMAGAFRAGSRVAVQYISYQGTSNLTREQAEKYLAWLDAGNVGRHYEALRETEAS